MDGAPGSLAFDGSLLLGAKDTTLYVLDSKSGRLIEEVAAVGGRLLQVAAILGEQHHGLLPPGGLYAQHASTLPLCTQPA